MSFKAIEQFLKNCVDKKSIPGAVCWIGDMKNTYFFESCGNVQVIPFPRPMKKHTIFDLASLTKPLCTATLVMKLYEDNKIRLDDRVSRFIPEFKDEINGHRTIEELLIHRTGIPAWYPLYLLDSEERWNYLARANTGLKNVIYSCLGYIILGRIIEDVTKERLDRYFEKQIVKKFGLRNTFFNPRKTSEIAPTEMGNVYEKRIARKYGDVRKIVWRRYLIKGEVHDGNAFYCFGGVAANAGLFSNATDLARLIRAYLAGEIINRFNLRMMIQVHTRNSEKRGLGWVIDPFPEYLPAGSFGHTGFTGTMLLCIPDRNLIIILLTNAVHPRVRLEIMKPIRKRLVQLMARAMHLTNR